jgi:hypothetical protein
MSTYILVDTANTFFRARHVVRGDIDTKVGMALHITLNSVKKAWTDFNADHVVFCLEGRSWRKDYYEPYKRNRQVARDALTPSEAEEDKVFWEIFDEFKDFIGTKTNCTMMRHPLLEAFDDKNTKGYNWNNLMLQRWTDHNGDEHRVLDDYNRNVTLCDLSAQPSDIREIINNTIHSVEPKDVTQVGLRLMKFCAKWDMQRIADQAQTYSEPLQARYPK